MSASVRKCPEVRSGTLKDANGTWNSASKAAYPADLNLALAKAFGLLINSAPLPLDKYSTASTSPRE